MRKVMVHPTLARRVAAHVTHATWGHDVPAFQQVQPGVFVSPDGEVGFVVTAAAQVSEPGVDALRKQGYLWELLVLQEYDKPPVVRGPAHTYSHEEWMAVERQLVSLTRDAEAVLSRFEVMPVLCDEDRAALGAASAIAGACLPTDTDPDPALLDELVRQVDRYMEGAA